MTSNPDDWPFEIPGVDKIDAWSYLTSPEASDTGGSRSTRVFNLCRSYRYQSLGYYVSLLAEARGHKPLPGVITVQDLKTRSVSRLIPDEMDELIQQSLASLTSDEFTLSVYFGHNVAKRYERLALHLFNLFPVPLMKFGFTKRDDRWQIRKIAAVSGAEVPESHREFVAESATRYFSGRASSLKSPRRTRFDMAILENPDEKDNAPSDPAALNKLVKAAREQGVYAEIITRDDSGRLLEFDSLFIRETTSINHHTYRFARRAASEGLVVIDDPVSICRCTNKVFLAEMLTRHKVDIPLSIVVHRDNAHQIGERLRFPCVLKKPDSSFSIGVVKTYCRSRINSSRLKAARSSLRLTLENSHGLTSWHFMSWN